MARTAISLSLLTLLATGACASKPAAPPAQSVAAAPAPARLTPERAGDEIWTAFAADQVGAVYDRFDAQMARAISSDQMREVWRGVVAEVGPLRSWKVASQKPEGGGTTLIYDLVHERGHMTGQITLAASDQAVAGLFVRPGQPPIAATPASASPAAAAAPPAPTTPGVKTRAVQVGKAPLALDGIVAAPDRPGKFPALVLLAGSGPADKDETLGPNKPFRDLAEGLAEKGIVSLRYDKRTRAHPEAMDIKHATVEDEVILDALAALELLRQQPEVDPTAIFVVGHSLGAQLTPEIARRDGRVAGLVLMAPSARPMTTAIVDQLRFLGKSPQELAPLIKQARAIERRKAASDELFFGVPASYFVDLDRRDGVGTMKKIGKPVLLMRGARDYQVTDADFKIWQAGLKKLPSTTAVVLPNLNHLFMAGEGPPGPAEYLVAGKISAAAVVRISAFVKTVVASR
jgi:dienelactone hydrolase